MEHTTVRAREWDSQGPNGGLFSQLEGALRSIPMATQMKGTALCAPRPHLPAPSLSPSFHMEIYPIVLSSSRRNRMDGNVVERSSTSGGKKTLGFLKSLAKIWTLVGCLLISHTSKKKKLNDTVPLVGLFQHPAIHSRLLLSQLLLSSYLSKRQFKMFPYTL